VTRREWLAGAAALAFARDVDAGLGSVSELSARLRKREVSSVELTKFYCDRLEKLGPQFNALASMMRKPALSAAKDVDGDLKRGRFRGPLQGIPYAAKDLFATKRGLTTWGAKPYAEQKFDYDAAVIRRLDRAKAILIGKLAMVELAGGPSYSAPSASMTGPARNPWNPRYWAGGSSSGSGVAVAAGLAPFALGTETSGSILTPAAFCGITGLRPTFGLVSRYGAMPLSPSLDKVGPMCVTAEDCGLVLAVIAGGDDKDPGSAGRAFFYAPQLQPPPSRIRVGWSPEEFDAAVEPARAPLRAALEVFREMGVQLVETKLPESKVPSAVGTIISAEGAAEFRELIESGRVDELADAQQIEGLKEGMKITAADYLRAKEAQREVTDEFPRFFYEVCDVYLAPSRLAPANPADQPFDRTRGGGRSWTIPVGNLAGLPALSLPCGFVPTEGGDLPVGVQLMARQFGENRILALGVEFQRRTDWHKRRPNIA
jgi:aspartyl-tRNA(Asn)/glutamyl-tRNA(Gln) amidotransferase subunit A